MISLCLEQLEEPNPVLRQWLAICLGRLWQNYDTARWYGARDNAHDKLINLLWDEIPDVSGRGLSTWLHVLHKLSSTKLQLLYTVQCFSIKVLSISSYLAASKWSFVNLYVSLQVRAAAVFALGTYVLNTSEDGTSEMRITIDQMVGTALLGLLNDGSSIVRKVHVYRKCGLVG